MFKRGVSRVAALSAGMCGIGATQSIHRCHGVDRIDMLEARMVNLELRMKERYGVKDRTGTGNAVFSWDEGLTDKFPQACKPFEKDMHGGFNEDDTGIVYTGIPGAGLFTISPDLTEWSQLGTDPRLKDNIHGVVVFKHPVTKMTQLALAQNNDQRVLIVNAADGTVLQELTVPAGGEFDQGDCAGANAYYSSKRQLPTGTPKVFSCTDVTFLDGKLYVVTGYCEGDFVLQAHWCGGCGKWKWGDTAWGGKGTGAGRFQTAHGVFAHDKHIYVANREAHEVVKFTPGGRLVEVLPDIPAGSRICNLAYAQDHKYFVMNALAPLGDADFGAMRTAPIFAHDGDKLLATIDPGSLGIPVLKHLHHVWPHYVTAADGSRQLYILVHGWRDGKFCVLKHEKQ